LIIIKYETVIGWRRQGYRLSWMKLSLRKTIGRPAVDPKVKTFLKQMAEANPVLRQNLIRMPNASHWSHITPVNMLYPVFPSY